MERRHHPRLNIGLRMKYQVALLESDEVWGGEGSLRSISPDGVYFSCDDHLPLDPGQRIKFTITALELCQGLNQASCFMATGLVVRVERPTTERCGAISVKFLSPLGISHS
jgi:PilZ domain